MNRRIKGVKVINSIKKGNDNILHTPCKDKDGNIYLPFINMKNINGDYEIFYLYIPTDLPIVDVEDLEE